MSFFDVLTARRTQSPRRSSQRDILPSAVRNAQMGATIAGSRERVIDSLGLVSTANFPFSSITAANAQNVTAALASPVDVTGASFEIKLPRSTVAMFLVSARAYIDKQAVGNFDGNGIIAVKVNNESIIGADTLVVGGRNNGTDTNNTLIASYTIHRMKTLGEGTNTVKLVSWIDQGGTGNAKLVIASVVYSYLLLGS